MKKIFLLVYSYTLCTQLFAQSPVQWEVSGKKTDEQNFLLQVNGTLQKGWHIYASRDEELGLEPLTIIWDNETILPGVQINESEPLSINDKVFNKTVKVFTNTFS